MIRFDPQSNSWHALSDDGRSIGNICPERGACFSATADVGPHGKWKAGFSSFDSALQWVINQLAQVAS